MNSRDGGVGSVVVVGLEAAGCAAGFGVAGGAPALGVAGGAPGFGVAGGAPGLPGARELSWVIGPAWLSSIVSCLITHTP